MRRYRCFVAPAAIQGNRARLSGEESHYLRHVLRMQDGERLELFDGQGNSYQAILRRGDPLGEVEILKAEVPFHQGESPLYLILALAMIKGDRFEWVIQKGTELGVNEFQPFLCRHSEWRPKRPELSTHKLDRWETIARAAASQCRRSVIPKIHPVVAFTELASRMRVAPPSVSDAFPATQHGGLPECRVALMEQGGCSLQILRNLPKPVNALAIVAPEGGWDHAEEAILREFCLPLSLGPRIFRSETAAITAAVLLQSLWGDLA